MNPEENNKLFSFGGIIGRYNYFLNCLHIYAISLIFTTPYMFWALRKAESSSDMMNLFGMLGSAPAFLKFFTVTGLLITVVLSVINGIKRINDILGKENNAINIAYAVLNAGTQVVTITAPLFSTLFHLLNFIVSLILLFKHGKITSLKEYNYKKEFNWGAFLGTWIWGIYNKSYIPLWNLILFFTPWGFYFALLCGMKGNEWAYKNKKWNDVEGFNKSQEKQTVFWAVFDIIVVPLISIIMFTGMIVALVGSAAKNPEAAKKAENSFNRFADAYMSALFVSKEIGKTENKFYINEADWHGYTFNEKAKILETAASYAAQEKRSHPEIYGDYYFSKTSELPVTKIYSAENSGKLLGEFNAPDTDGKNFSEIMRSAMNAYKFYN